MNVCTFRRYTLYVFCATISSGLLYFEIPKRRPVFHFKYVGTYYYYYLFRPEYVAFRFVIVEKYGKYFQLLSNPSALFVYGRPPWIDFDHPSPAILISYEYICIMHSRIIVELENLRDPKLDLRVSNRHVLSVIFRETHSNRLFTNAFGWHSLSRNR